MQTAVEVMVEHTDQSRPSQAMVIKRTNARVIARYGVDVVAPPSRTAAYRILAHSGRTAIRCFGSRRNAIAISPAARAGCTASFGRPGPGSTC